jgi:hypothetical protein
VGAARNKVATAACYSRTMATSRRRIRIGVLTVVGVAVLVLNPVFGVLDRPSFGAEELRAAIEGTWRLTVRDEDGAERTVTFRLAQGSEVEGGHASARALVRPAAACGRRTLVKSAGACRDHTWMPLEVTLIAEGGERPQAETGELLVFGTRFDHALLEVSVAELRVSASVTPAGEVRSVSSLGDAGRALSSTLVRIAR